MFSDQSVRYPAQNGHIRVRSDIVLPESPDGDLRELIGAPVRTGPPPDPQKEKVVSVWRRNNLGYQDTSKDSSSGSEAIGQQGVGRTSALDLPLRWTHFPTQAASTKQDKLTTLRGLADIVSVVKAADKDGTPWLKLATFGWERTERRSLRSDSNLTAISGIEADYDAGVMTVDEAAEKLRAADLAALIYTTPSHGVGGKHKWRLLLPLSREMAPDKAARAVLVERVNAVFGGALDQCMFTLSQAYHYEGAKGACQWKRALWMVASLTKQANFHVWPKGARRQHRRAILKSTPCLI